MYYIFCIFLAILKLRLSVVFSFFNFELLVIEISKGYWQPF